MNIEDDILIEKFLENLLSEIENSYFLNRLKTDKKFKQRYMFEKQLRSTFNEKKWSFISNDTSKEVKEYEEVFKSDVILSLKKTLVKENNNFQNKSMQVQKKRYYIPVAVVILFLISLFYVVNLKKSNEELATYYLNDLNIPSLVTRGNTKKNLVKAQQLFEQKKYQKSLEIFKKHIAQNQNATIYIYIGISQSKLNLEQEALQTFDSLINSKLLDAPKGKWFKALIYLKLDSVSKSKKILKDIVSNESYNFVKAKELLQKLD